MEFLFWQLGEEEKEEQLLHRHLQSLMRPCITCCITVPCWSCCSQKERKLHCQYMGAAEALDVSSHLTFALPLVFPCFVFHESGISLDIETFKTAVARRNNGMPNHSIILLRLCQETEAVCYLNYFFPLSVFYMLFFGLKGRRGERTLTVASKIVSLLSISTGDISLIAPKSTLIIFNLEAFI